MSFFFWLDILSTLSLIFDIGWISDGLFETGDAGNASKIARAGRASRIGTRAGRIVRIVRLIRLVKLYKHAQQAILEKEALVREREAMESRELEESRKGIKSESKGSNQREFQFSSRIEKFDNKLATKSDAEKSLTKDSPNKNNELNNSPERQIKRRSSLLNNLEKARVEKQDKSDNENTKLKLNLIKEDEAENFPDPERLMMGENTTKNNKHSSSLNGNMSDKIDPPAYPDASTKKDGQFLDLSRPNRSFGDSAKKSLSSPSHKGVNSKGKHESEGEVLFFITFIHLYNVIFY